MINYAHYGIVSYNQIIYCTKSGNKYLRHMQSKTDVQTLVAK